MSAPAAVAVSRGAPWLYWPAAVVIAVLVFAGFARNYYLRVWFGTRLITPFVHLHGLVMTTWIVLFVTQTTLIARGRTAVHRRLGPLGGVLAILMVLSAGTVTLNQVTHRTRDTAERLLMLVAFDGAHLCAFAVFVALGVALRRRSDVHKRLMLLATVCLLPPALGRITGYFTPHESSMIVLWCMEAIAIGCLAIDTLRNRRVHPVMVWGTAVIMAVSALTYLAGRYT